MPNGDENQERKDRIERLKKGLYGQADAEEREAPDAYAKRDYGVKRDFQAPAPEPIKPVPVPNKKMSMLKKVLIGSFVFFVIAVAIAVYTFTQGGNLVSAGQVDFEISAPISVNGGEEVELEITITNKNDSAIETADLTLIYPTGTYTSVDSQKELVREKESLGTIAARETVTRTVQVALFGEENSEKVIIGSLEFRFAGTSALLEKTTEASIGIISSPINLSVELLNEVSGGQEFELSIRVQSNSTNVLQGILVQVDTPFGFELTSSSPSPLSGTSIWNVGDLPPSGEQVILLRGTLDGQEGEEKVFRVFSGAKSNKDESTIGTIYSFVTPGVMLTQPFLALDLLFEGRRVSDFVGKAKRIVRADVVYQSTIPTRIVDGEIEVRLSGNALDRFAVQAGQGGFYRSVDNTIIWSKNGVPDLASIEPKAQGNVKFSFTPRALVDSAGNVLKNPEVIIEVSAKGRRISDVNVPEDTNVSKITRVKIESELALAPRIVYFAGPFTNTGSLPPKAEQETTYTVIWTVTNSSNTIENTQVRTTLPPYMRFVGTVSPASEDISFSEIGGEVVWNVGTLQPGVGFVTSPREVAFQVALLSSLSQVGQAPVLIGETTLMGDDRFTGTVLEEQKGTLTSRLSTDPQFRKEQALVGF